MRVVTRVLCFVAAAATVHTAAAAPAWTAHLSITNVEVVNDGGFLVWLSTPVAGCAAGGAIYIYSGQNGVTADGAKALLAITMQAQASGSTVAIEYDPTSANCWGTYIQTP